MGRRRPIAETKGERQMYAMTMPINPTAYDDLTSHAARLGADVQIVDKRDHAWELDVTGTLAALEEIKDRWVAYDALHRVIIQEVS